VYFTLFFLHAKYILCMPFNCVGWDALSKFKIATIKIRNIPWSS
jgi:hypothetical protein